jgi:hypothetical protein
MRHHSFDHLQLFGLGDRDGVDVGRQAVVAVALDRFDQVGCGAALGELLAEVGDVAADWRAFGEVEEGAELAGGDGPAAGVHAEEELEDQGGVERELNRRAVAFADAVAQLVVRERWVAAVGRSLAEAPVHASADLPSGEGVVNGALWVGGRWRRPSRRRSSAVRARGRAARARGSGVR